jgi:hypothetical protein
MALGGQFSCGTTHVGAVGGGGAPSGRAPVLTSEPAARTGVPYSARSMAAIVDGDTVAFRCPGSGQAVAGCPPAAGRPPAG